MDDEFELGEILSNAERQAAEREAQNRAARESEQRAREDALARDRKKQADQEREILLQRQQQEELRRAQIAAMSPIRRFIIEKKPFVLGFAGLVAVALVAALAVGTARWNESVRASEAIASCDPAKLDLIPADQRRATLLSWIECPSETTQLAAVNSLDEDTSLDEAVLVLRTATASDEYTVRSAAAKEERLPIDSLVALVDDPSEWVREVVARQERLPASSLVILAKDPFDRVRGYVALNPNTPDSILLELASDSSPLVQSAIMDRSDVGPDLLLVLTESAVSDTCEKLLRRGLVRPTSEEDRTMQLVLERLTGCLGDPDDREELVAILQGWNGSVFEILSTDWDEYVRTAVASSDSVPAQILVEMSKDESALVRASVAMNRRTPPDVLITLVSDPDDYVHDSAMEEMSFEQLFELCVNGDEASHFNIAVHIRLNYSVEASRDCSEQWRDNYYG